MLTKLMLKNENVSCNITEMSLFSLQVNILFQIDVEKLKYVSK